MKTIWLTKNTEEAKIHPLLAKTAAAEAVDPARGASLRGPLKELEVVVMRTDQGR